MKRYSKLLGLLLAVGILSNACREYKFPDAPAAPGQPGGAPVTAGTANFSNYVAVGNSLTAGFMDNALYLEGQQNSYPLILSQQMALAGGGAFVQPLMPAGDGFGGFQGTRPVGRARFVVTQSNPPTNPTVTFLDASTNPVTDPTWATFVSGANRAAMNNFGVPGIALANFNDNATAMASTNSGAAAFFQRFTIDATTPYITQAANRNATFFTFWLGNNDILGYATSGALTPSTPSATFGTIYGAAVNTMLAGSTTRRGVVANIPDVTSIPFFNTVPSSGFPPAPTPTFDATTANGINALWGLYFGLMANPAAQPLFSLDASGAFPNGIGATTLPLLPNQTVAQFFTAVNGGAYQLPAPAGTGAPINFVAGARTNGLVAVTSRTLTAGTGTPASFTIRQTTAADRMTLTAQGPGAGTLAPATGITGGITPPLVAGPGTGAPPPLVVLQPPVPGQTNLFPLLDATTQAALRAGLGIPSPVPVNLFFVPTAGPIRTQFVLDNTELAFAQSQVAAYNTSIQNLVNTVNSSSSTGTRLGLFNANQFLANVNLNGFPVRTSASQNVVLTSSFPLGGLFSLDGVHPTPAGYAVIANQFINTINTTFGATLPQVDVTQYRGVIPNR
jgi:hypothetical protein